jgi:hypothetical protein
MCSSTWRRGALGAALLTTLAFGQSLAREGGGPTPPREPTEIEVKAAFLFHFAQLVTWPETDADEADPGRPIVVAVVGRDPFGRSLEGVIGQERVRGRPIKIERASRMADLEALPHILYVGASDRSEVPPILAAVLGSPVLTVAAVKGFAQAGGMVEFRVTPDARVAFDINLKSVERAGLKMSSQLLKIARVVGEPGP